jgi:hypothetical protein
VHRSYRTRHARGIPGWGPAPGWGQPLPGWSLLVDHGPRPLRVAGSVARWRWPTLVLAGFGAVVGFVLGHDHPDPGLSPQGLLTVVLAAVVVVLLTVHRRAGPGALARAAAEDAVVALLAALLTLAGGVDQQPATSAGAKARHAATEPRVDAGDDRRPGVLRVAAGVARAVTKTIRAVTGAVGCWPSSGARPTPRPTAPTRHPRPPRPRRRRSDPPPPCSRQPGGRCDPALC